MFGTLAHPRKPILLLLVFGVFLMIVGITALAQAILVSTTYSQSILESVVGSDAATVRAIVNANSLNAEDFEPDATTYTLAATAPASPPRPALAGRHRPGRDPSAGRDGHRLGRSGRRRFTARPDRRLREGVEPARRPPTFAKPATAEALGPALTTESLLREYFPLKRGDQVLAVVGLWRDGEPISARLGSVRQDVIIVTLTAGLVAAFVLFLVFRAGPGADQPPDRPARRGDPARPADRHAEPRHARRRTRRGDRDGAHDQGADRGRAPRHRQLPAAQRHPRPRGRRPGDPDPRRAPPGGVPGRRDPRPVRPRRVPGHRAVGRGRGPRAGDRAAPRSPSPSARSSSASPSRCRSRSAPASAPTRSTRARSPTCCRPRRSRSRRPRPAAATPSASPARTSRSRPRPGPSTSTRGSILAVDGRDRYTKRHSEDVARYAVYLAERLGLEPDLVSTIRVAGLLHDVGKIGVPDGILRKPARLTEDEFAVMKQHVALGDLIVRDLPDCDLIRAGIRHHHERWDGGGYPDGLAGEDIPLVARIVAVADAFSAMTTTRPYRKALDVDEALRPPRGRGRQPARRRASSRSSSTGSGPTTKRRCPGTRPPPGASGRRTPRSPEPMSRLRDGRDDPDGPMPSAAFVRRAPRAAPGRGARWPGRVRDAQTWTVVADRLSIPYGTIGDGHADDHQHVERQRRRVGIGCVTVAIPTAYVVTAVDVPRSLAVCPGRRSIDQLAARDRGVGDSNGDRLRGDPDDDVLVLKVSVTGKAIGVANWTANEYQNVGCNGNYQTPVVILMTVLALPGTATPKPTPEPTPDRPRPRRRPGAPTPTPTPHRRADRRRRPRPRRPGRDADSQRRPRPTTDGHTDPDAHDRRASTPSPTPTASTRRTDPSGRGSRRSGRRCCRRERWRRPQVAAVEPAHPPPGSTSAIATRSRSRAWTPVACSASACSSGPCPARS